MLKQLPASVQLWISGHLTAVTAGAAVAVSGSLMAVYVAASSQQPSADDKASNTGQQQDTYRRIPNSTAPGGASASGNSPAKPTPTAGSDKGSNKPSTPKPSSAVASDTGVSNPSPASPSPAPGPAPAPPTPASMPHITRSGTMLMRAGVQYKFAGLNADTWFGCWANEAAATNEENLQQYFSELNRNSMTRIWPYGNTNWEATMDRVVRIAEQHGQYLMVTLSDANDNGTQCGSNKGSSYPADGGAVKTHAQEIVARYKDSPAVAVWEICNECSRNSGNKAWYVSIAQAIKAIDTTTLVASGAGTCYQTTWQNCVAVDDFPENDLVSMHEYDYNGGGVSHWTDETQNIAAQLGKPWFSGETGFTGGGRPTGLTTSNFGQHLTTEWNAYLNASGSAGMLYWDMKWTYDFENTVNVGGRGWEAVKSYTHAWQGS